jgi:hypothetical protein
MQRNECHANMEKIPYSSGSVADIEWCSFACGDDVMMKRFVGATVALSLIAAPTIAVASSAPTGRYNVTPASDSMRGEQLRGGIMSPLFIILLLDLAALIAALADHNKNPELPSPPTSP